MAGIGWKLERMLERGTLSSTLQAYLAGVAVTSAPWLLTTAVLVTLRVLARGQAAAEFAQVELLITLAYASTLVLSAPIHIVVSRYAADRLYERRLDHVARPLRRALTFTLFGFLAVGITIMTIAAPPLALAVPVVLLTAIIAAQWLLLGVGGGMSSPAGVIRAFAVGTAASVLAAVALERTAGLGARGYLIGFTFGQAVALLAMLVRILRDLPAHESPVPRGALAGAFHEYRLLATAALLVHAAVWVDKVCTWLIRGPQPARTLASASALAWFAVIPASAWIYIQVETSFYRMFRRYYGGIESGAGLDALEASARAVRAEAARLVRGAIVIQLVVLVLAMLAAPRIVMALGLAPDATVALRWSLVAASLQLLTLLALLLLYYLDLRREAVVIAVTEFAAITLATMAALAIGAPPALGAALGSIVPALQALWTLRRVLTTLVPDTFQSQPYGELL
jgi:uncharacterized membrane protein